MSKRTYYSIARDYLRKILKHFAGKSARINTPACRNARSGERRALQAYCSAWPRYCQKCGGAGLVSWRENGAPHGSGESWPMEMSDSCLACVGQGICPRCGSNDNNFAEAECDNSDGKGMQCNSCGWKEGMPGAPEVESDCGCLEDSLDVNKRPSLLPLLDWIDLEDPRGKHFKSKDLP